jgi:hypothetical protein
VESFELFVCISRSDGFWLLLVFQVNFDHPAGWRIGDSGLADCMWIMGVFGEIA